LLEPADADEESVESTTPAQAQDVVGDGEQQHNLKRSTFVLVLVAVWIPAGAIGLGLYRWWFHDHSPGKSFPVFVVLIFVLLCTVGALLLAMASSRPLVAAFAIALMSAPYAAVIAAAPLYGWNFCEIRSGLDPTSRCLVGIVPY